MIINNRFPKDVLAYVLLFVLLTIVRSFSDLINLGNVPNLILLFMFFIVSFVAALSHRKFIHILIISIIYLSILTSHVIFENYSMRDIISDTSIFVSGIFLLTWMFFYSSRNCHKYSVDQLKKIIYFCWSYISVLVIFSKVFSVGSFTYESFESGNKFFFASNNELTYVYGLFYGFLFISSERLHTKLLFTLVYFIVISIIGTKSGLISFALLAYIYPYYILDKVSSRWAYSYIFVTIIAFLLISFVVDLELIAALISPILSYSSGYQKFLIKADYAGVAEALFSGRIEFALFAFNTIAEKAGNLELVFGLGFSNFKSLFGLYFGNDSFTEIDIVDVFVSFGLVGTIYYVVLMGSILYFHKFKIPILKAVSFFTFAYTIILGNLGGHVFFSSWAMVSLSVVILYLNVMSRKGYFKDAD